MKAIFGTNTKPILIITYFIHFEYLKIPGNPETKEKISSAYDL